MQKTVYFTNEQIAQLEDIRLYRSTDPDFQNGFGQATNSSVIRYLIEKEHKHIEHLKHVNDWVSEDND